MLILKAKKGNNWYDLEVYEEQAVNITKQFSEVEQINKAQGSFSLSFRLPATTKNIDYFGAWFDANEISAHNPKVKVEAEISVDTLPLLKGYLQLKGTYSKIQKYHEFEVVVFGEAFALREIGDKLLNELDWSEYEHENDYATIEDSIDGNLFTGDIRYGLVDRGQQFTGSTEYYPADFTQFIRHKAIIDKIFEESGLTYQSDFFNSSDFLNWYTPLLNGKQYANPTLLLENNRFRTGITVDQTFTTFQNHVLLTDWSEVATGYFDPSNLLTSNVFNAPYTAYYEFRAWITLTQAGGFSFGVVSAKLWNEDTNTEVGWIGTGGCPIGETVNHAFTAPLLLLEEGVNYTIRYIINPSGGSLTIESTPTFDNQQGTGWALILVTSPLFGAEYTPAFNFPKITVNEYLTSLQKCFNLVFVPDTVNDKRLIIEPFNDYLSGGDIVDWSEKLHIGKDKDDHIEPTTDIQKRRYEWTFKTEGDVLNKRYQDSGRVFGRYLIEDLENDFASGDLKIEPNFGAYPTEFVQGTGLLIHKAYSDSFQPIESKIKLVRWVGALNIELSVFDGTDFTPLNAPMFSSYSQITPNLTGIDGSFGADIPQHPIDASPEDNLYNKYWAAYVAQLYSPLSRKRTAYFRLNALDILNAKFSDTIYIVDSYWRILSMNTDINSEELVKVELIKIIDTPRLCEFTPVSVGNNNKVTFENAAGETSDGSQQCCNFYGYTWTANGCFQTIGFDGLAPQVIEPIIQTTERNTLGDIEVGTALLFYRGEFTTNEVLTDSGRISIPNGSIFSFQASVTVSEFDTTDGTIIQAAMARFDGVVAFDYGLVTPNFEATVFKDRTTGPAPPVNIGLTVTMVGEELVFTVDDTSDLTSDVCLIIMRIDYVVGRN